MCSVIRSVPERSEYGGPAEDRFHCPVWVMNTKFDGVMFGGPVEPVSTGTNSEVSIGRTFGSSPPVSVVPGAVSVGPGVLQADRSTAPDSRESQRVRIALSP